jgi:hypothetical protein
VTLGPTGSRGSRRERYSRAGFGRVPGLDPQMHAFGPGERGLLWRTARSPGAGIRAGLGPWVLVGREQSWREVAGS